MSLNRLFLLSLGTSLLSLSACASFVNPQWMGKGYKYQDNSPLSSPAPSSPWIDEAVIHDTEKLATNNAAWQGSVFELLDSLTPYLPQDGAPLRLSAVDPVTPHDMALDHYLRQALIQKGYNLTTTEGVGTKLTYDATESENGNYVLSAIVTDSANLPLGKSEISAVLPYEKRSSGLLSGYFSSSKQEKTATSTKVYDRQ